MIQLLQRAKIEAESDPYPAQQFLCAGFGSKYSCSHCNFGNRALSQEAYNKCKNANQCADGTSPWIPLEPSNEEEILNAVAFAGGEVPLYTKSRVLRMVKVNGMPVYLQLIQCNADGYRCNTMCYYYAQRMKNKVPASKCAATKGCGFNGSFYNLLVPSYGFFRKMLQWNGEDTPIVHYTSQVDIFNLRVQNVPQVGSIYVVTYRRNTSPVFMQIGRIINDIQGSSNYGKMLSADGTWVNAPSSSRLVDVQLTAHGMDLTWWLVWNGLPLSTIYPESLW